jgi:hypothetical protein
MLTFPNHALFNRFMWDYARQSDLILLLKHFAKNAKECRSDFNFECSVFFSFAFSFGVYYQNKTKTIKIIKPQGKKKHYKNQN